SPAPDEPLKTVWGTWGRALFWDSGLYHRLGVVGLALLVPVGAIVSKVFGDITFWSAQHEHKTEPGFREVISARFAKLIRKLLLDENATILVVAHSQGTVIAIEHLQNCAPTELSRISLITMGSPLHTLYSPLFGLYGKESCDRLLS